MSFLDRGRGGSRWQAVIGQAVISSVLFTACLGDVTVAESSNDGGVTTSNNSEPTADGGTPSKAKNEQDESKDEQLDSGVTGSPTKTTDEPKPVEDANPDVDDGGNEGGVVPLPEPCEGDDENNDTLSRACLADLNKDYAGVVTASSSDTADCFAVSLESKMEYSLLLESTNEHFAYFTLTTASGSMLLDEESVTRETAEYHVFSVPTSELAYLCVEATNTTTQSEYRFRFDEERPGLVDLGDYEPNDTLPTAFPVSVGKDWSSTVTARPDDTQDCYSVELEAGTEYSLLLESTNEHFAYFTLTTASGSTPLDEESVTRGTAEYHLISVAKSEVAYLCVEASTTKTQSEYRFHFHPQRDELPSRPDYEPNDTFPMAFPVSVGKDWVSTVTAKPDDIRDCYSVELKQGKTYSLLLESTNEHYAYFTLTTASGSLLLDEESVTREAAEHHEISVATSEVVYLCVEASKATIQSEYRFRFE